MPPSSLDGWSNKVKGVAALVAVGLVLVYAGGGYSQNDDTNSYTARRLETLGSGTLDCTTATLNEADRAACDERIDLVEEKKEADLGEEKKEADLGEEKKEADLGEEKKEADLGEVKKPSVGKFVLHVCGLFYMFVCLYVVCDEFFVPALDKLSNALGLSPDVAGATFMAAGGSAPEFFTSLVSAFSTTSSDTGIAAIVGSAVFNVLFVIGACGLASPTTLQLSGYPLTRDCTFYLIDLVVLWWAFADGKIECHEAAILFGLYVIYAVFMGYSGRVEECVASKTDAKEARKQFKKLDKNNDGAVSREELGDDKRFALLDKDNDGEITLLEFEWELRSRRNHKKQQEEDEAEGEAENLPVSITPPGCDVEGDDRKPSVTDYIWYAVTIPVTLALWLTVPDVRRSGCWKKMYIPAFALSILWIAVFSKFMVDFSETVGNFTGLPTRILAVTLLAWGTSIPDLLTSVLVTLQGHGDMAVSSSIGSNIFDVTVGLPVPWMLAIAYQGKPVAVSADGIATWILILIGMVIVTIGGILATGWKLGKPLGAMYIVLFVIFMVYMIYSTL